MDPPTQTEAELEQFRQQWKAEVQAKSQRNQPASKAQAPGPGQPSKSRTVQKSKANLPLLHHDDEAERSFPDIEEKELGRKIGDSSYGTKSSSQPSEPKTALEYYERGAENEGQGRLGESLSDYRKAFKVLVLNHQLKGMG
jgi:F-box protein 9